MDNIKESDHSSHHDHENIKCDDECSGENCHVKNNRRDPFY